MGIVFILTVLTANTPILGLPALLGYIAVPWLVWILLRRAWIRCETPTAFAAVWLHGICSFLFGGILLAVVVYVMLQYVMPGFVEDMTLRAAMRLAEDPEHVDDARKAIRIIEAGNLPSPIRIAFTSIWFAGFTGSLWSMICAAILTRTKVYRRKRDDFRAKNSVFK